MYDTLQMHFLCSHKGEAIGEVKAHLIAECGDGAGAGAVTFHVAVVKYMLQKL